ncbi:MBOAT family protein, partial [Candidatus Roizmanbacteria bacterium]|nr:MBOAT family protein [Candidatus Roizmanbacteria bacterium]
NVVFDSFGVHNTIPHLSILLPIGLSFHTFQSLSYTFEVYYGRHQAERNFGIFALYVMFYPQLVAGPIERPQNLLDQFSIEHKFDYEQVTDGLRLMLWGFFKKVVIADRLAVVVNQVYNNPTEYSGLSLLIATYFFTFQIFCDFSGYSDIAIGAARVMGFNLMNNFNRPYFSKSISEFWGRWHISLSTWFRDYLYIPLGGNRVEKSRWYFNLFFVFLVSGLWHGANWTYIVWGALHGSYLIVSLLSQSFRDKVSRMLSFNQYPAIQRGLKVFITFNLVSFAWIFFRASSISDAFYVATHLFTDLRLMPYHEYNLGLNLLEFLIAVGAIGFMELIHVTQKNESIADTISRRPVWLRWSVYYVMIFAIIILGKFDDQQFIYFQF